MSERATKFIDLNVLREEGFLQEANRLYFHPLGLALQLGVNRHGRANSLSVWDYREDPEGVIFDEATMSAEKGENVAREFAKHAGPRGEMFGGSSIQPLPPITPMSIKDEEDGS